MREVIILAGGLGTRLGSLTRDTPKPLIEITPTKKFLDFVMDSYVQAGFDKIILSVCHLADQIIRTYGHSFSGVPVKYSIDSDAYGTGGAIREALIVAEADYVFIANGDTLIDSRSIKRFVNYAEAANANCMLCGNVKDNGRYGTVEIINDRLHGFQVHGNHEASAVNCGLYGFNATPLLRELTRLPNRFSFEDDFLKVSVSGFPIEAPAIEDVNFIDIGIPEAYSDFKENYSKWINPF